MHGSLRVERKTAVLKNYKQGHSASDMKDPMIKELQAYKSWRNSEPKNFAAKVCLHACPPRYKHATILNYKAAAPIQYLTCKTNHTAHNAHLHTDHL